VYGMSSPTGFLRPGEVSQKYFPIDTVSTNDIVDKPALRFESVHARGAPMFQDGFGLLVAFHRLLHCSASASARECCAIFQRHARLSGKRRLTISR
jgi:hypothetical protein